MKSARNRIENIGIMIFMRQFIAVLLFTLLICIFSAKNIHAQSKPSNTQLRIEAVVTKVIEDSQIIEDNGNKHPYQKLGLIGTSGQYKGKNLVVENGKFDQSGVVIYKLGDSVVLSVAKDFQDHDLITITDYVRRLPLLLLFGIFIVMTIIVGGLRGASSLLGMIVTFSIIFLFILPQVLKGGDPVLVTIFASLFIIPITFCLSHGLNKKTLCAVGGTLIALLITGLLAALFVNNTHLSGFASEESNYLDVLKHGSINMQGLLLAGIIIGLLGVLQDITISQAAVVYQLKNANSKLKFHQLFTGAMDVGRDHIASMANTLILVYAGVSLPLLLLFINNPLPFSTVINFEIIAEEVVRTLVASIGLIIAVPITTLLTVAFVELSSSKAKA